MSSTTKLSTTSKEKQGQQEQRSIDQTSDQSLSSTLVEDSDQQLSSSSSSSSNSSSDDSSDSDSEDSDSEVEEDGDGDETEQLLSQLLLKAKQSARERESTSGKSKEKGLEEGDGLAGNEELVLFGDDDEQEDEEESDQEEGTPRTSKKRSTYDLPPSLVRPLSLPQPSTSTLSSTSSIKPNLASNLTNLLEKKNSSSSSTTTTTVAVSTNKGKGTGSVQVVDGDGKSLRGDKWGQVPKPRLSKNQLKANKPHTAGSKWFDMPATPMTPELKRELDAMRLRNALDPKKFMKGGAKKDQVGEFFQIGHVITPSTRATNSTSLPTITKRSFVEELVEDEQARAYAKRKTKEVMQRGMSGRKRQRNGGKGSYAMGMGGGRDGGGEGGGKKRKR